MLIKKVDLEIQRQPFARPFAFKGSSFNEKWNLVVRLEDDEGQVAYGVGGLAVLWSDGAVFAGHTETGGNLLQASLLEHALQLARGVSWEDPSALLEGVLPQTYAYGVEVTGCPALRPTFALNALVALDNAAWMLWARRRGIDAFEGLVPQRLKAALGHRQQRVAAVPAVGYNMPLEQVDAILEAGACMLKVKIGHPGDEDEMLRRDMDWLERLHRRVGGRTHAACGEGPILFYLDANGRYTRPDSLRRLADCLEAIGALGRVALLEEPFDEEVEADLHDVPLRLAADESLHRIEDVEKRRQMGYGAIAVKPAGKTLSLAFGMIEAAAAAGLHCFVADNACVPLLVEWNKNVAARLPPFPGIDGGILETNGPENYGAAWEDMLHRLPGPEGRWLRPENGCFVLDEAYYRSSGGLFVEPTPYSGLIRRLP